MSSYTHDPTWVLSTTPPAAESAFPSLFLGKASDCFAKGSVIPSWFGRLSPSTCEPSPREMANVLITLNPKM